MNYKYLGEAIALLGIAYSIFRWVARNVAESDRSGPGRIDVDVAQLRWPGAAGKTHGERAVSRSTPVPTPAPDPKMLNAAAAMFGIPTDAIIAMDPRERALLLSGYQAARKARDGEAADSDAGE